MDVPLRCHACLRLVAGEPQAQTFVRRGAFAIVVSWRICSCGATLRDRRVEPVDIGASPKARMAGEP